MLVVCGSFVSAPRGNYRPQLNRKINFSTLELRDLVHPKSSYPRNKVKLVGTFYNLVILTDIVARKCKQTKSQMAGCPDQFRYVQVALTHIHTETVSCKTVRRRDMTSACLTSVNVLAKGNYTARKFM